MLLSALYDYLTATGAEGASIVVVVHGHRIELDLSGLRNPPEQQSALWARPERLRSVTVKDHCAQSAWNFSGTVFWLIPAQRVPSVR